jgi:hypothetical protein
VTPEPRRSGWRPRVESRQAAEPPRDAGKSWRLGGGRNWLFTWLDEGGERTAAILTIIATCIAHSINPRAYLHLVTKLIAQGFPQAKLRDLLPDRLLAEHPELYIGDRDAVPALAAA